MPINPALKSTLQRVLGVDRYLSLQFAHQHLTASLPLTRRLPFYRTRYNDLDTLISAVRPGSVCVDVGANLGIYTIKMAEAVGPTGKVFSFEPVTPNHRALLRHLPDHLRERVMVEKRIVSDCHEEMSISWEERGGAFEFGRCQVVQSGAEAGTLESVYSTTLDAYFANFPRRIDLIKCDVENHELEVLRGARALIAQHSPILLCEVWNNERLDETFAILEELGYSAYHSEGGALTKVATDAPGWRDRSDYFFLRMPYHQWVLEEAVGPAEAPAPRAIPAPEFGT